MLEKSIIDSGCSVKFYHGSSWLNGSSREYGEYNIFLLGGWMLLILYSGVK